MAAIYSIRMGAGLLSPGAPVVLYTCPSGCTAVVRCLMVVSSGTTGSTFNLDLTGVCTLASFVNSVAAEFHNEDLRVVLSPGDSIEVAAAVADWYYAVSGYQLSD